MSGLGACAAIADAILDRTGIDVLFTERVSERAGGPEPLVRLSTVRQRVMPGGVSAGSARPGASTTSCAVPRRRRFASTSTSPASRRSAASPRPGRAMIRTPSAAPEACADGRVCPPAAQASGADGRRPMAAVSRSQPSPRCCPTRLDRVMRSRLLKACVFTTPERRAQAGKRCGEGGDLACPGARGGRDPPRRPGDDRSSFAIASPVAPIAVERMFGARSRTAASDGATRP